MKFTTALLTLLSAAVAVSATVDSNESGLHVLGERSFERKARHTELAARAVESKESENLEARDWVSKWGKLTWYAGGQLDNPACGGPTPTDDSMVVAVKENGGYGKCGEKVHIHWKGRMVEAHIVDYCAGKLSSHMHHTSFRPPRSPLVLTIIN